LLSRKTHISRNTIENYINKLCDSFIFHQVKRYDIKGKNLLKTNPKYYATDIGMRQVMLNKTGITDTGHLIENIVYIELLRRGYSVSIGKSYNYEVDFIATKNGGVIEYYQVSMSVLDENALSREIRPFEKIKDFGTRYLLTLDKIGTGNINGIRHYNIIDWLLGKTDLK
jgi:predicted AAA+ superfamily ATPase